MSTTTEILELLRTNHEKVRKEIYEHTNGFQDHHEAFIQAHNTGEDELARTAIRSALGELMMVQSCHEQYFAINKVLEVLLAYGKANEAEKA